MNVGNVMTQGAVCTSPEACAQEAAMRMRALDVGALPVCEEDRLIGMVTDRDITIRCTAACGNPLRTKIRDVMTDGITYCFEDQHVDEAARLMEEKQVRRLVVLNRDKRLVGIVSLGDLAVRVDDRDLSGEILKQVSKPVLERREKTPSR